MSLFHRFNYNVRGYFANHLTQQVKELYSSVAISDLAKSMIGLFEPVYLYVLGYSLREIILFFVAVYFIYLFTLPLGAKIARRYGYEHSIFYSTFFLIFYYLCLFAIPYNQIFLFFAIPMLVLEKSLYWPGYHSDFARFSTGGERGREISTVAVISAVVYIVGPLVGGTIITIAGFKTLFLVVAVLILVSNIPLLATPEVFKPVPFSYFDSYKRFFRKRHRRKVIAYLGYGEEFVVLIIWPVFIYLVLKSYFSMGGIIALATLATTLVVLYVGRASDKSDCRRVLKIGTLVYALSWFLRYFAITVLSIFGADTLSRISKDTIHVPITLLTYTRAVKGSIMKEVVLYEMSLVVGKLIAAFLILGLSFLITSSVYLVAFIIAGLMTFLYAVR